MTIKIFTVSHIPEKLANAWLQHLRDFDAAYPDCHFEILADAPNMPLAEMAEAMRVSPGLKYFSVAEHHPDRLHPSHRTRISMGASSFDEICKLCGATDRIGSWGELARPCSASDKERFALDIESGRLKPCDVRQATHVKFDGGIERIREKWGINEAGHCAKPSEGGFGVVTESGKRVGMMDANLYYQEIAEWA